MKVFKIEYPYFAVIREENKRKALEEYQYAVSDITEDTEIKEITTKELMDLYDNIGKKYKERQGVLLVDGSLL